MTDSQEKLSEIFCSVQIVGALLRNTIDCGWVDNRGQYWGILEGKHGTFLTRGFGLTDQNESFWKDNSYIHISPNVGSESSFWYMWDPLSVGHEPNEAQRVLLEKIGFDLQNEFANRNTDIRFEDVFENQSYFGQIMPNGQVFQL